MTDTCKYCGSQDVKWTTDPSSGGAWRLLDESTGKRHTCAEYMTGRPQLPSMAKRKKAKTGAFLRWYGPLKDRQEAMLVETQIDPDSPAGFYHLEPTRSTFDECQKGRAFFK